MGWEARRLERPALLAESRAVSVTVFLDSELTLAMRAGPWAGTRADDQRLGLTAAIPVGSPLAGIPVTLLAGIRRESGFTRLRSQKEGTLFELQEVREWAMVGFASHLPYGLSFGALFEQGSEGPHWLGELRYRPAASSTLWLRHREEFAGYRVLIPDGAARKVSSPEMTYAVQLARRDVELGGEWRVERAWAMAGVVAADSFDAWAQVGGKPLPWLALQLGADRELDRYDDRIRAEGTGSIASVDLGIRRERIFAGADFDLGSRDLLSSRYVYSRLTTESQATEVGTNAAQALLHVDYDFGLLFESGYSVEGHQLALGWSHVTEGGLEYSLGGQYFQLHVSPGSYALTSEALGRALAAESLLPTTVYLAGLTGAIDVPIGSFRIGAAAGQLIPLATRQPGAPSKKPSGSGGGGSKGSWLDRLAQGLRDYGGGSRLLLRLTTDF